ncbi:MAG: hypothetical protein RLZZ15_3592, partial [Verrucomicrobiota bacterium]
MLRRFIGPQIRREWRLYFFILPSVLFVGVFAYLPTFSAVYHSFFEWAGGETKQWVGFDNFTRAFHDRALWSSFKTVAVLVGFNLVKMIPAVLLAVVIHRLASERSRHWYRVLVVVPMVVPHVVTVFVWKFLLDPNLGALNRFLDLTGAKQALVWLDRHVFHWQVFFEHIPVGWLSQPELVLPALFIWGFPWIGTVGVLIYLAGLQAISPEIYEAAELDGVGPVRKFFRIELPLILTQVRINLLLLIVGTLQGYGLLLLLLGESGGPGGRGLVPGLWMYNRAFVAGEFGYACAVGLVIFAFILALTWL